MKNGQAVVGLRWLSLALLGALPWLSACPRDGGADPSEGAAVQASAVGAPSGLAGQGDGVATSGGHAEAGHGAAGDHAEGGHAEAGSGAAGEHAEEAGSGAAGDHAEDGVVAMGLEAQKAIGLGGQAVQLRPLATELVTTGEFQANADREAHVTTRIAGRVSAVLKNVGDSVRAGERLAVLDSVELGQAQAAYLQALARWSLAEDTAKRQRALLRQDLIARKEVLAAENALRLIQIELDSARNQLALYGFGAERVAQLARTRRLDPSVPLTAPISALVLERHLTVGEMVLPEASQSAFRLSNVADLWVDATVFEKDLGRVRVGQATEVTTLAYPGQTHRGRVSLVSTALDEKNRTARARIVVPNPLGHLRPGMTATVRIAVGERLALAVPVGAIVRDQAQTYVFVRERDTRFERRAVGVGAPVGGWVPVATGLKAGDWVVVKGSFTLKAELNRASFGEHAH